MKGLKGWGRRCLLSIKGPVVNVLGSVGHVVSVLLVSSAVVAQKLS